MTEPLMPTFNPITLDAPKRLMLKSFNAIYVAAFSPCLYTSAVSIMRFSTWYWSWSSKSRVFDKSARFTSARNPSVPRLIPSNGILLPTSILAAARIVPSPPITKIHCVPSGISIEETSLSYWS